MTSALLSKFRFSIPDFLKRLDKKKNTKENIFHNSFQCFTFACSSMEQYLVHVSDHLTVNRYQVPFFFLCNVYVKLLDLAQSCLFLGFTLSVVQLPVLNFYSGIHFVRALRFFMLHPDFVYIASTS